MLENIGNRISQSAGNYLAKGKTKLNDMGKKAYKSADRYLNKNTVRAKYNRHMDTALVSGLVTVFEGIKLPTIEPHEFGILGFAAATYLRSTALAMKEFIQLQPIRNRAIKIKKAAKAAQKNSINS
ncbi:MAG: hypothetical protein NC200_04055 [Candidatus Gastranaerophilales bacterium]|nr:hypothetical protein [Candidatus Gastranaerophilales bacterium]